MEAVAAMAVSSLVFIAPTSSSCGCSGIQYRALNLAHTARGRGLESSSSLYFFGGKLQTWKFVENAAKWRNAAGSLRVRCDAGVALVEQRVEEEQKQRLSSDFTTVMKFGGSSVASAHRMREVAQLILSFPDERPVIVLSAMGKTTNNLLKVCSLRVMLWNGWK